VSWLSFTVRVVTALFCNFCGPTDRALSLVATTAFFCSCFVPTLFRGSLIAA
jgi:hypothetical protein